MSRSPAFQFYPADFLADENVVVMPLDAVGAYIKTMCFCWREESIPCDPERLARLCNTAIDDMNRLIGWLKPCYDPMPGDPTRWVHPRLDRERRRQAERHEKSVADGARGAQARWNKSDANNGVAIAKPSGEAKGGHSSSSSSSSSTSVTKDSSAADASGDTVGSEESSVGANEPTDDMIYRAYPRQKEPTAARAAISRAVSSLRKAGVANPRAWLLQRTRMYADARKKLLAEEPGSSQFTPYPQKWFNKGCYNEDPANWSADGRSKPKPKYIDPDKADEIQRRDRQAASEKLRQQISAREDIAKKIAALRALPVEQLSKLKASVVADQPEARRSQAMAADPFGGAAMTVLMYAKLVAPQLADEAGHGAMGAAA